MYMAVDCGSSVAFDDLSQVGTYQGSDWGERLFCKTCGSSLVWQTQDGKWQGVSMHLFENPEQFTLKMQWFIDKKPANYALTNGTEVKTQAECFAMFAKVDGR